MSKRNTKGFTLLEILIVVAVIAILVAIGLVVYSTSMNRARESVCEANRRALQAAVYIDYMTGGHGSPDQAFDSLYQGDDEDEFVCPEGGVFSWVHGSGSSGRVACSIHGDGSDDGSGGPGGGDDSGDGGGGSGDGGGGSGDGGDSASTYPGTNIALQANYWPTDADFEYSWSSVTIPAGTIFQYTDGNYYIVTKTTTVTKSQAASGPGGDLLNWYATQKITGNIVTYSSSSEQKSTLQRGDICQVGDDYYVYVNGGSWAYGPDREPGSWYKIS